MDKKPIEVTKYRFEFNCKYCGELNHFYVSKKTKELKKAIWACKLCHYKNRVLFK